MMNKLEKLAHKGTVLEVNDVSIILSLGNEKITIPRTVYQKHLTKGDTLYLSLLDNDSYNEHHANLSKTILNTIFGAKP